MAAFSTPVVVATQKIGYLLADGSRIACHKHAVKLNGDIYAKRGEDRKGEGERDQNPNYKLSLGSEMNVMCLDPRCTDPIVKRPRTLVEHHLMKHERAIHYFCGPCGKEFKLSMDLNKHLQTEHSHRSYCSMLHFTVIQAGFGEKTGSAYPYMSDKRCWCDHIVDHASPLAEMLALGLIHPFKKSELKSDTEDFAPMPVLRTRATKDPKNYVRKPRPNCRKKTVPSGQVVPEAVSVQKDIPATEDVIHAAVSVSDLIHATDVLMKDVDDTLALGDVPDYDEVIDDDGDWTNFDELDDVIGDDVDDIRCVLENIPQSAKLSEIEEPEKPVIIVNLKHTSSGIKSVSPPDVVKSSKRPRGHSSGGPRSRKRQKMDTNVQRCFICKHGDNFSEMWLFNTRKICCSNGVQRLSN